MTIKVHSLEELTNDQLMRKLAPLTEMAKPLLDRLPMIDISPNAGTEAKQRYRPSKNNQSMVPKLR
jgi:hypothetical protein